MHIVFIHQAFPAQFGELALALARDRSWRCTALVESLSTVPPPSEAMLRHVEVVPFAPRNRPDGPVPWPLQFQDYLGQCRAVLDALRTRPDLRPDLIVAHGGRGAPTAFLPEILDCPILVYCEYYFALAHADLTYRLDLPPGDPDVERLFPRCINATTLLALTNAHAGYSPTHWQKQSFPARSHDCIDVAFDGVDTSLYRPERKKRPATIAGRSIDHETRVVTFVARGLESVRGYDLFLDLVARIARERPDTLCVVAGAEEVHYGWDRLRIPDRTFAEWARARHDVPQDRLIHLGHVDPTTLADVLSLTNLHVYLSVPFVTSWSLFDAMSSGAAVLAGDVPPVRELIDPGSHGLLEPLFDADALADAASRVLDDPALQATLGHAARQRIERDYSLDVCIPRLATLLERTAQSADSFAGFSTFRPVQTR